MPKDNRSADVSGLEPVVVQELLEPLPDRQELTEEEARDPNRRLVRSRCPAGVDQGDARHVGSLWDTALCVGEHTDTDTDTDTGERLKYRDLSEDGLYEALKADGAPVPLAVSSDGRMRAVLTFSSASPQVEVEERWQDAMGGVKWVRLKGTDALYSLDFDEACALLVADAVAAGSARPGTEDRPDQALVPKGAKVSWWMSLGPYGLLGVSEPEDEPEDEPWNEHLFDITASRVFCRLNPRHPLEAAQAHFFGVEWTPYEGRPSSKADVALTLIVLSICRVPELVTTPPAASGTGVLLH